MSLLKKDIKSGLPLLLIPKAFTLVELIVVVTILAILATVGFASYTSHLSSVRDTTRINQLSLIRDNIELYRRNKKLPLPTDYIEIKSNGTTIGYQGYVGESVLSDIKLQEGGKDPMDKTYYTYYITKNKKNFQLLAFLEEEPELSFNLFKETKAETVDYEDRYVKVTGERLGVLTESGSNTPVQEVSSLITAGELDIATTVDSYIGYLSNEEKISGSGSSLVATLPNSNCLRIKDLGYDSKGDGIYTINPTGLSAIQVYCDMTTDGGGWTGLLKINPSVNDYSYWRLNPGTKLGDDYNHIDKGAIFTVNEIYVNKIVGWDGGEYYFEKVGNDLYSRRGTLKNFLVKSDWTGLSGNFTHWIGNAQQNNATINSITFQYFMYTDINLNDFPFYVHASSTNDVALSDIPWGGRGFTQDVDTFIFVR